MMAGSRVAAAVRVVPAGGLALCALAALRQSYRVRRAIAETTPPEAAPLPSPAPPVSIVLPVRNEEANVDGVVASLLAQDYPAFDVTVIDDGSTDATSRLLAAWAARDPRLRIHRIDALPEGWAGKAHALHTGSGLTSGAWLLFTDADTRHAPQTLRLMVGHAVRHGDDLLSMFTDLRLVGPGSRLLTPIGALTLIERATPAEVRDPAHRHALAVGQYILIRRVAYTASGGYAEPGLQGTFADDVALAELLKRQGRHVDIVGGRGLVSNEQWTTWGSAWRGWRKGAYGEVAPRPLLGLAGGLLLVAYGLVPLGTLLRAVRHRTAPLPAASAAITLAAQIDAHARFGREYGLSPLWSLTAPAGWAAFGVLLLDTVSRALSGRGADWKGRTAPPH
jgi:chlorobactene glucosyltransferase